MRTIATFVSTCVLLLSNPLAALAAPVTQTTAVPEAALVDRDGDRISDGLQASLNGAASNERFEVVANTTADDPAAFARARVGRFAIHREYSIIAGFHATMTKAQIQGLAHSPKVIRIEENFKVQAALDASQADFGTAAARADYGPDGAGVGVCLIDTGADPNHEQLDGSKIVDWIDYVNGRATAYDDHGHGTHVLSTAVGDGIGGSLAARFKGVAPAASAFVAKVLASDGYGEDADVVSAVQWCANHGGVDVINMSIGSLGSSDGSDAISQAVNNAANQGKVTVAASGNTGDDATTIGSPGAAAQAITVASVSKYSAESGYHTDGIYLSEFSSRGPTLDGRTKPDVAAPGERTVAAKAGTTMTYVENTGTSMATPFAAGTVALALNSNPALSVAQVKAIVMGTAQDRGEVGTDNEYGAGLLDGYAVVAQASGDSSYEPNAFPSWELVTGSVSNGGSWSYSFDLGPDDLDAPVAATILIQNQQLKCVFRSGPYCFAYEYSPDLDAELIAPNGSVLDESTCPLGCYYYSVGRQETLAATPTDPGRYTVRVYSFEGTGSFVMDLSHGPVATTATPPPPSNEPPVATDDAYGTSEDTTLNVAAPGVLGNDSDVNGDSLSASLQTGPSDGTLILNPDGSFHYTPDSGFSGTDSFTYVASDGQALSNVATATLTVDPASPPPPGGDPSVHVGDLDSTSTGVKGEWIADVTITIHDEAEAAVSGVTVSFSWSDGSSGSCTTSAEGTCVASKTLRKRDGSISLTVIDITGGDPYVAGQNHDPDGSSNGTTIVVTKP